jgi:hypothetical protein
MPAGDRESDRGGESETGSSEEISFEEQYRETAINCFRYFHFTSFEQVDRMTIAQYEIMLEALEYQMIDDEYRAHRQAFLNFAVQAEKKSGKKTVPVYRRFRQFFDYEKELKKMRERKKKKRDPRFIGISKLLRKGG